MTPSSSLDDSVHCIRNLSGMYLYYWPIFFILMCLFPMLDPQFPEGKDHIFYSSVVPQCMTFICVHECLLNKWMSQPMNQCFFLFPLPKCTLCVPLNFQVNIISFIGSQIHCPSEYLDKGLSLYNNLTFSASSFFFSFQFLLSFTIHI